MEKIESKITYKSVEMSELIYEIREQRVMLDTDLAALYGISTRVLNQAVERNSDRFPPDFSFIITSGKEIEKFRARPIDKSSRHGGLRKPPRVSPNSAWRCFPVS